MNWKICFDFGKKSNTADLGNYPLLYDPKDIQVSKKLNGKNQHLFSEKLNENSNN